MVQLAVILVVFLLGYAAIKWVGKAGPKDMRRAGRMVLGGAVGVAGVLLTLRGALDIGIPLAVAGLAMVQSEPLVRWLQGGLSSFGRPLEMYLDRRFPGWRQHVDEDARARMGGAANAGAMSEKEAYEILGLQPGASAEDVLAAHRRLIRAVHPDKGGSNFLASRINAARDRLLNKHR